MITSQMAGPIEVWSGDSTWPFRPTGDGRTCHKTHETADFLEMFGQQRIICPLRCGGYVYGYSLPDRFVRRAVRGYALLEELARLTLPWEHRSASGGMRESLTSRELDELSYRVRRACRGALPESWGMLRPDAMATLAQRLLKRKNVPADVLPTLQRFGELYELGLPTTIE